MKRFSRDIFAVVLAVAVGIIVWFSRALFDFLTPPQQNLQVPSLIGLTEADGKTTAHREHLETTVIARRSSDRYPAGVIMGQDPIPETPVRPGRRVSLIISRGITVISMPDLRYRSQREVSLILNRLHLRVAKTHVVDSDAVDAGHVVDQNPAPLVPMREGDTVALGISRGQPSSIVVNDFIGLDIADARTDATRNKLRLGQVVWTPFGVNGPPRGVVVRQRPAAGSMIDPHQMVSLQVSAGPHQYGYLVREVHAALTVPLDAPSAQLRVTAVDSMGTRSVYDGFAAAGARLDLITTTVGPAELDTYLNNELISTTVVAREPAVAPEIQLEPGNRHAVRPSELGSSPRPRKVSP